MSLLNLALIVVAGCAGAEIQRDRDSTKEAVFSTLEKPQPANEKPVEEDVVETIQEPDAKEETTKTPTLEDIEKANKECVRDLKGNATKDYNLIFKKEFTIKVIEYCAEKIGVPVELIVETIRQESGFLLTEIGDHGKAIGLGQVHLSRFKHAKLNPRFAEIMAAFTDTPVSEIKRGKSVLVDALSITLILKDCLNANKIKADHTTRLTASQIIMVRYYYHTPTTFKEGKGKFFQEHKERYLMYANGAKRVRKLIDKLSGQNPQAKAN
ncbi:hypothetical protein M0P48_04655 [Candidatus Gracilibacteria bacterium]|jgi:hypothetical protein|nr:hypothetical protein [Candidatus Gracilibacteria bacterium]